MITTYNLVQAQEKDFTSGASLGWRDWYTQGLRIDTRNGVQDLVLGAAEYPGDTETDLLLHFNPGKQAIAQGDYRPGPIDPAMVQKFSRLGGGSAAFHGGPGGLELIPGDNGAFYPGQVWKDFTLEFWLYPANLTEGESVISWEGAMRSGEDFQSQSFRAWFQNRRLVWDLRKFFFSGPESPGLEVKLTGRKALLPRTWHHHTLRFSARTGLLEYLIDGLPESSTHVTPTGSETNQVYTPWIGNLSKPRVVLGAGFTGFIDELRLSKTWQETQVLEVYGGEKGTALSPIYDLKAPGSSIKSVKVKAQTKGLTDIRYYYRFSNQKYYQWTYSGRTVASLIDVQGNSESSESYQAREDDSWIPFTPGQNDFLRGRGNAGGRYVQFKVVFLPEGSGTMSPRLTEFTPKALMNSAPPAPSFVEVKIGDSQLIVQWSPVNVDILKGYRIWIGTKPGRYDWTIDAGKPTLDPKENLIKYGITEVKPGLSLRNDTLYYITVTAYTEAGGEKIESPFSRETAGRPGRMVKP